MNKTLTKIMLANSLICGSHNYDYMPRLMLGKSGPTQKTYTNKNANIEYYYDEKGNIRKKKK